jgi:hypothetical protein
MSKRVALFTAAGLAAGAWAFVGYDRSVFAQERDREVSGNVQVGEARAGAKMELPKGITRSDRADEAGIRRTLGGAVEAVLKEDDFSFNNLSPYLASNDRTRFAGDAAANEKLNQRIRQLRTAFKDKYDQEFDIREEVVFGEQFRGLEIVQGEVSNPALLSNWPVEMRTGTGTGARSGTGTDVRIRTDVDGGSDRGQQKAEPAGPGSPGTLNEERRTQDRTSTGTDVSGRDKAEPDAPGSPGTLREKIGDDNAQRRTAGSDARTTLDRGMNVAIVTFPESHGAAEFNVSLVREDGAVRGAGARADAEVAVDRREAGAGVRADADLASADWKMDVPSAITADQLQANLARHIDEVLGRKDRWPAEPTEAYRSISHHLLYAFYDTGMARRDGAAIDRNDAQR